MNFDPADTIVAVASAPGSAARGIVRLSGTRAASCLGRCFTPASDLRETDVPHLFTGNFRAADPLDATPVAPLEIPCDVLFWPNERSYTGEPVAEIQLLGAQPLVDAVVARLCEQGARLAQPGEFTLRAFLAGKIDLTHAEAVLGVIDAEDPSYRLRWNSSPVG